MPYLWIPALSCIASYLEEVQLSQLQYFTVSVAARSDSPIVNRRQTGSYE